MLVRVGTLEVELRLSSLYVQTPKHGLFAYLDDQNYGAFHRRRDEQGAVQVWWGRLHVMYDPPRVMAELARQREAKRVEQEAWWAAREAAVEAAAAD